MRRKAEETERSFTEEGDLSSFRELKSWEQLVIWRFQYLKRSLPDFVFSSAAAEGFLISSCWRFGVTFFNGFSSSAGMIVLFCSVLFFFSWMDCFGSLCFETVVVCTLPPRGVLFLFFWSTSFCLQISNFFSPSLWIGVSGSVFRGKGETDVFDALCDEQSLFGKFRKLFLVRYLLMT